MTEAQCGYDSNFIDSNGPTAVMTQNTQPMDIIQKSMDKMEIFAEEEERMRKREGGEFSDPSTIQPPESLDELIAQLRDVFAHDDICVEYVQKLMTSYQSNPKEWKKFAKFDKYKYTRNLVDQGNGKYNLMILCWNEAQGSGIHSHADSHCFLKVLNGTIKEELYEWPDATPSSSPSTSTITSSSSSTTAATSPPSSSVDSNNSNNSGTTNNRGNRKLLRQCESIDFDDAVEDGKVMKKIREMEFGKNQCAYINDSIGLHRVENESHVERAVTLHLYSPPFQECQCFDKRSGRQTTSTMTFWSKFGKRTPFGKNPAKSEPCCVMEDN